MKTQKSRKGKHVIGGLVGAFAVVALALLSSNSSMAATATTQTTLKIKTGALMFFKDTGTTMNSYFGATSPNSATAIDLGSYTGALTAISAASTGDHRFTLNDQEGKAFTVTLASSALTAWSESIAASNITYTGSTWNWTGKVLTATGTFATSLASAVTFVWRTTKGLSNFAQEITLKVTIPAAQAPEDYTGMLTFTITQP